ncbi:hypothetical protein [Salinimonas chungwhensis]|uniref:hypothetical protein n=1 Tax=Salinimonas chungwhensis TaxID=265425 RepID=UPI000361F8B3|nr:hypothetical protein [Salinimonas chungwhensis]
MTLVQSRQQHFIALLIRFTLFLLYTIVFCFFLSPFTESKQLLVEVATIWLVVNGSIFIWLALFNSGHSKLAEHSLRLGESGITYSRFTKNSFIAWQNIASWCIKKGLNGSFTIRGEDKNHIAFGYFTFSSQQRELIAETLHQHCPDKRQY